jgi:hypothetical protein
MKRVSKAKVALNTLRDYIQDSNLTFQSTAPIDPEPYYKEVLAQLDRLEDIILVASRLASSRKIGQLKEKYKEE